MLDFECMFASARPPPPVAQNPKQDENGDGNQGGAQVVREAGSEAPECKGKDICSICGAGGDCVSCPICNPYLAQEHNAALCDPSNCKACIEYYDVPTVAIEDGVVLVADAARELSTEGVSYSTDKIHVSVDTEDLKEVFKGKEYSYWSEGGIEYRLSVKGKILSVVDDEHSYVVTWEDEEGDAAAMKLGVIIANKNVPTTGEYTGCPLSTGVRADA